MYLESQYILSMAFVLILGLHQCKKQMKKYNHLSGVQGRDSAVQMKNASLIWQTYYQYWSTRQMMQQPIQFHIYISHVMWFRGCMHTHFPPHTHKYTSSHHKHKSMHLFTQLCGVTREVPVCLFFPLLSCIPTNAGMCAHTHTHIQALMNLMGLSAER